MIFRIIAVQRIIPHSVFRQHSCFRKIGPLCNSPSIRQTVNKEYSKMTYQIEERGSPNSFDYKLYISKLTLKLLLVKKIHRPSIFFVFRLIFLFSAFSIVERFKVIIMSAWPLLAIYKKKTPAAELSIGNSCRYIYYY